MRFVPGRIALAVGIPLGFRLFMAHLGRLEPRLAWALGGMALVMLLTFTFSKAVAFEASEVHLHYRLLGVTVISQALMPAAARESVHPEMAFVIPTPSTTSPTAPSISPTTAAMATATCMPPTRSPATPSPSP